MSDTAQHVHLTGGVDGDYLLDEQLPDGRLVLRPRTRSSLRAQLEATGARLMTPEEFDRFCDEHHVQPADGDG